MNQPLISMADKLNYILENYISASEVTRAFGFKSNTMVSKMRKGQTHISTLHLEGLEKHFDIPTKLFEYNIIYNKKDIDILIQEYKDQKIENQEYLSHNFFKKNTKLIRKLKGRWYAYSYPNKSKNINNSKEIQIIQTEIHDDYTIIDENKNRGIVRIGQNQSLILMKSYNNDNLTIIHFQNRQILYNTFRFVIISTQSGHEQEIINFGFYSRTQYNPQAAKEILGDSSKIQIKLDSDFNERIINKILEV